MTDLQPRTLFDKIWEDHVVVDEGGAVDELDAGRGADVALVQLTVGAPTEEQQGGAKRLAGRHPRGWEVGGVCS